jgi:hypothetical protein
MLRNVLFFFSVLWLPHSNVVVSEKITVLEVAGCSVGLFTFDAFSGQCTALPVVQQTDPLNPIPPAYVLAIKVERITSIGLVDTFNVVFFDDTLCLQMTTPPGILTVTSASCTVVSGIPVVDVASFKLLGTAGLRFSVPAPVITPTRAPSKVLPAVDLSQTKKASGSDEDLHVFSLSETWIASPWTWIGIAAIVCVKVAVNFAKFV